jgi:hypothetical protein
METPVPWLTVCTTPRRTDYLAATIAAIDEAGGSWFPGRKVLYVDGKSSGPPPVGWELRESEQNYGNAHSAIALLRAAARARAPYLLFFEDDIILTRYAVDVMCDIEVPPECFMLQFCDLKAYGDPRHDALRIFNQPLGADESNTSDPTRPGPMWGNQALKVPLRSLVAFTDTATARMWRRKHHADILFSNVAAEAAGPGVTPYLGIVAPSLVQHVGLKSLCNPTQGLDKRGRIAHNFPGVDFDARSLLGAR